MLILYPIDILSGDRVISWREAGSSFDVTLDSGVYYASAPWSWSGPNAWPSLYAHILDKLNALSVNTYELSATDATVLPGGPRWSGIKIERVAGTADWGVDTDASDPIIRALGFNQGSGLKLAAGDMLYGEFSRWGVWQPPAYAAPKVGGDARQIQTRNKARRNGVVTRWGTDEIRTLQWGWLPAGYVRRGVNSRADFAQAAGFETGDHGNYFYDVWARGISTYRDLIRVDGTPEDLEVASHPFEILRSLPDSSYADDFSSCLSARGESAETYRVEVGLERIGADDRDFWGGASAHPNYIRCL